VNFLNRPLLSATPENSLSIASGNGISITKIKVERRRGEFQVSDRSINRTTRIVVSINKPFEIDRTVNAFHPPRFR